MRGGEMEVDIAEIVKRVKKSSIRATLKLRLKHFECLWL